VGFLSGPTGGEPVDIALDYIHQHRSDLGLTEADLSDVTVSDQYKTEHNGVTHIYLVQRLDGVRVFGAVMNINISANGEVINLGNSMISNLGSRAVVRAPAITPECAIEGAAAHLGLTLTETLTTIDSVGGLEVEQTFSNGGISRREIPVRLSYQQVESGEVLLTWMLSIEMLSEPHWWNLRVDVETGEIVAKDDMVDSDTYDVYPAPLESPGDFGASQQTVTDPADVVASPYAWHDTNGGAGAEFTDTRGNNVFAQEDADDNNSGGFRPDGGAGLNFNYAHDPTRDAFDATNQEAAIVNLFYLNNIIHDTTMHYGFDEAAGNFQETNYSGQGNGSDSVNADAQDGFDVGSVGNANFSTPPDGGNPRMQMFIWLPSDSGTTMTVNSPPAVAGLYEAGRATFGESFAGNPVTGDLELVNGPSDPPAVPTEGCGPLVGFTPGKIAMIDRGTCDFSLKVLNAENAGATAVVVANNQPGGIIMAGGALGAQVTIGSLIIQQIDGDAIKDELDNTVNVTLEMEIEDRDSSMDATVVFHEYAHGISNRLVGGPGNVFCLNNDEQMGEGWSDFFGLVLTAKAGQSGADARGVATYVVYQAPGGPGIRTFPYTTDLVTNPQTYDSIKTAFIPHGVGEVWNAMLWEMYWELVDEYGFDADIATGSGGNNVAIQLVIDGLKLTACHPNFVQGRDAILAADLANNAGANECAIWRAFAKRGLGVSASAGSGTSTTDGTEAFDLPTECNDLIFIDGFESGDTIGWDDATP